MPPINNNTVTKSCAGCHLAIKTRLFLCCSNLKCKKMYDLDCAGFSEKQIKQMDISKRAEWRCPECQNKLPKVGNINTPVRAGLSSPPAGTNQRQTPPDQDNQLQDGPEICDAHSYDFDKLKSDLSATFQTMIDGCMEKLYARIDSISLTFSDLSMRMDAVEERVSAIELTLNQESHDKPSELVNTIEQLKVQLNNCDQEFLLNDVEISGIPERSGEDPVNLVTLVGSKLGVAIQRQDIVSVRRVGARRVSGDYERPRVLVLRVERRQMRERLLKAARERRGANTKGFQLPGEDNEQSCHFYINERLTKLNRKLLALSRQESRRLEWRHPWTRDGVVYVQCSQKDSPRRIRTEADLHQVFVSEPTGNV